MRTSILAAITVLILSSNAFSKDYLSNQSAFDAAWTKLTKEAGVDQAAGDVSFIQVLPDRIELVAPARPSRKLNVWRIQRKDGLLWGENDVVTNHGAPLASGRFLYERPSLFSLKDIELDRILELILQAGTNVRFEQSPQAFELTIGREFKGYGDTPFADLQLEFTLGGVGEKAKLLADAKGNFLAANIANTVRGRNQNFLTQTDWPFEQAQKQLAQMIGTDAEVMRLDVRHNSIDVSVKDPKSVQQGIAYSWDGGRFEGGRIDLVAQTSHRLRKRGAFALSEVDLSSMHELIEAARRYARIPKQVVSSIAITKEAIEDGHEIWWEITFFDPARGGFINSKERWNVFVRADGSFAKLRLPESDRIDGDFRAAAKISKQLKYLKNIVGNANSVYQIKFLQDESLLVHRQPGSEERYSLIKLDTYSVVSSDTPRGSRDELHFFGLEQASQLEEADIEKMFQAAFKAAKTPNGQVAEVYFWAGERGYLEPTGEPYIIVFVSPAGSREVAGGGVFLLDGTMARVIQ